MDDTRPMDQHCYRFGTASPARLSLVRPETRVLSGGAWAAGDKSSQRQAIARAHDLVLEL